MKKLVLYVLQQANPRALSPEAINNFVNQMSEVPNSSPACVRATLADLESQGFVSRRASVLDPTELTWAVTKSGLEVSTL